MSKEADIALSMLATLAQQLQIRGRRLAYEEGCFVLFTFSDPEELEGSMEPVAKGRTLPELVARLQQAALDELCAALCAAAATRACSLGSGATS